MRKLTKILWVSLSAGLAVWAAGCGKKPTGGSPSIPSLTVDPSEIAVEVAQTQQFTATVRDVQDQQVTWSVVGAGSIDGGGLYQAPATLPDDPQVSIIAESHADSSVRGSATVWLVPAGMGGLTALAVDPPTLLLTGGERRLLIARGTFSDGSTQDLSAVALWTSDAPVIAAVESGGANAGRVTGASEGTANITARVGAIAATSTAVVLGTPALVSVSVTPDPATVPLGASLQLLATASYSDGSTIDVTGAAGWSSGFPGVVTVDDAGATKGLLTGVAQGATTVTATFGPLVDSASVTVTPPVIESLRISPSSSILSAGLSQRFTATGIYSDGSTKGVTALVTWSSAAPGIATISNAPGSEGIATAVAPGFTIISATTSGLTASATLNVSATQVTLVALAVSPPSAQVAPGFSVPFTATGTFSDGSTFDLTTQVLWSSSDANIATVSNTAGSEGVASGVSGGVAAITASSGAISGNAALTVSGAVVLTSIAVTPASPTIATGVTQAFVATGTFSDGSTLDLTTQVTWTSSNTGVATISNAAGSQGVASGVSAGKATLTATSGSISGSATLTVTAVVLTSVSVTSTSASAPAGFTVQFTATGHFSDGSTQDLTTRVTWTSSDIAVATVSTSGGATGIAAGMATITATSGSISGSATLTVTSAVLTSIAVSPATASIAAGLTQPFSAVGTFSDSSTLDITTQVSWSSTSLSVATVSNSAGSQGVAAGVSPGGATISATSGGISGGAALTVTPAVLTSITVSPASATIPVGFTQAFTATGIYSDGSTPNITTQVNWTSSDNAVATISNAAGSEGIATGLSQGAVTITATLGGISGSAALTVSAPILTSITVSPLSATVLVGATQAFVATGAYSDGSSSTITSQVNWTSADNAVATISNTIGSAGVATGQSAGAVTITATLGTVSGNATLNVTAALLTSITVAPSPATVSAGLTQAFTATGNYDDGSTQIITAQVTWTSDNTGVATVSNAVGSEGVATGVSAGSATITATLGGVFGQANLTVNPAVLTSITVSPASVTIAQGLTQAFMATGHYSDGSTTDLTALVAWTTSDPTVASVSNAAGNEGVTTGVAPGAAQITATSGAISNFADVTITPPILTSITLAPTSATIQVSATQAFVATGHYSDGSTADVTTQVAWSSSNTGVATVSSAGVASGVAAGSANIIATSGSVQGQAALTVTSATLQSITVAPANLTLPRGVPQPYTATGNYSDGSTADLTTQVTWSSTDTGIATIDNTPGMQGVATTQATGSATIQATLSAVIGSTPLTVNAVTLASISLAPLDPIKVVGDTWAFTATGHYSDTSTRDLTAYATWSSTDPSLVLVSDAVGSKGNAQALDVTAPTEDVAANFAGVTGTSAVTVNP